MQMIPQPGVTAIIPISEITTPEMHNGKYSLVPTAFNMNQIAAIIAPTPKNIIKSRPGKGGGNWDYVPGWWFKKKANFVFGFSHDFEILGERIDGDFITVKGALTVRDQKTGKIIATKQDFGGAAIKYLKGTKNYLDLPNDFKAAQTDAFKRCMVQFGFAMDVYGVSESHDAGQIVSQEPRPVTQPAQSRPQAVEAKVVEAKVVEKAPEIEAECSECGNPMTKAEAEYSKRMYGRQLCRTCQRIFKQNNQKQ